MTRASDECIVYTMMLKAERLLEKAYHSTPIHVSSKKDIHDALMLIRGALQVLGGCGETPGLEDAAEF